MDAQEEKYIKMTTPPVEKLICRLAVPCIVSMLVTAFYNMADTYFVGMLKSNAATGAVGVVFSVMAVIQAVSQQCPDITMLGPPECFVHVVGKDRRQQTHVLRAIAAFMLLLIGSALAITWFHADVNMLDAQQGLYRLITGKEVSNQWLITIPYAAGVFFGVALFYALMGRKGTTSPLDIKLAEYQQSAEQAAGKTP